MFFSPALGMWFVTRHDDIVAILGDPATFSSRDTILRPADMAPEVQEVLADWRYPRHLINSDPPDHTRLRARVNQGFRPKRIARLEPTIREVADGLIDGFAPDGRVDLVAQFAYPLPLTIILRMLGVPVEDMAAWRRWTDMVALHFAASTLSLEHQLELARSRVAFQHYTTGLVEQRQRAPQDDMISHLLKAPEDGSEPLGVEQVVDLVPGLIIAGHETTAHLIANTVLLLLSHPEHWHALQRHPELVEAVVEEGLRKDSSVLGLVRTTTRAAEVGGVALGPGARLFLLNGSANHDESRHVQPEEFRLDRGPQPHLGFGRGIHSCIGAALARLETRIAIETLARRLPGLRLVPGQSFERTPNLVFRGLRRLELSWDPT